MQVARGLDTTSVGDGVCVGGGGGGREGSLISEHNRRDKHLLPIYLSEYFDGAL